MKFRCPIDGNEFTSGCVILERFGRSSRVEEIEIRDQVGILRFVAPETVPFSEGTIVSISPLSAVNLKIKVGVLDLLVEILCETRRIFLGKLVHSLALVC